MKIIPLYNDAKVEQWIPRIKKEESQAQKELYEHFAPKMLSVCRMYIRDLQYAEDCMIKGFVKVFRNCKQYQNKGNFEGWVRRIMINECLNFLKAQKPIQFLDENEIYEDVETPEESNIDIQALLDQLPEGYRIVFNLFVMEDMSHKEIAQLLNISESTSKTQYFRAKNKLKQLLKNPLILQK